MLRQNGRMYDPNTNTELRIYNGFLLVYDQGLFVPNSPQTHKYFSVTPKKVFHDNIVYMTVPKDTPGLENGYVYYHEPEPQFFNYNIEYAENHKLFHNSNLWRPQEFKIEYKGPTHVIICNDRGKILAVSDSVLFNGLNPKKNNNLTELLNIERNRY